MQTITELAPIINMTVLIMVFILALFIVFNTIKNKKHLHSIRRQQLRNTKFLRRRLKQQSLQFGQDLKPIGNKVNFVFEVVEQLPHALNVLNNRLSHIEATVEDLKTRIEVQEKPLKFLAKLTRKHAATTLLNKEKIDAIAASTDNMTTQLGLNTNLLTVKLEDLTTITSHMNSQIEAVANNASDLHDLHDDIDQVAASCEQINSHIEDVASSADDLRDDIDRVAASCEQISSQLDDVASSTEGLDDDIDRVATSCEQINTQLDSVATNTHGLHNDIDNVATSCEQMNTQLDSVEANTNGLHNDIENVGATAVKLSDRMTSVDDKAVCILERIDKVDEKSAVVSLRIEKMGEVVDSLKAC